MDQIATLEFAQGALRSRVTALEEVQLGEHSNCEPWTIRQLASHALNNQLYWGGLVTGETIVSFEETMGAVPYEGDLARYAFEAGERSLAMWRTSGALEATLDTPFGALPGAVVINFPTVDALCHAWDLAASIGEPTEFPAEMLPAISVVVDAPCTDAVREIGLIKAVAPTRADATETEKLMALSGRSFER
jgi:uncharacterized protein (TIGR03086 family)